MLDVEDGCEGVVAQLERWTNALMIRDFDALEEILSPDFQFTVEPKFGGGRMDKATFIDFDRNITSCSICFLSITARRLGGMVTSLVFAKVSEEFSGDLGPGMPSREEMSSAMDGARLAYGSGWRWGENNQWQCFSHHIFGFVDEQPAPLDVTAVRSIKG